MSLVAKQISCAGPLPVREDSCFCIDHRLICAVALIFRLILLSQSYDNDAVLLDANHRLTDYEGDLRFFTPSSHCTTYFFLFADILIERQSHRTRSLPISLTPDPCNTEFSQHPNNETLDDDHYRVLHVRGNTQDSCIYSYSCFKRRRYTNDNNVAFRASLRLK